MKPRITFIVTMLSLLCPYLLSGQLFEKHFGDPSLYEEGFAIINTPDGGLAVAGVAELDSLGDRDFLLLRVDEEGELIGSYTYGTPGAGEIARDLLLLEDGGFLLIGRAEILGNEDEQIVAVRTDAQGNQVWLRTFGSTGFERAMSIAKGRNESFLIVGVTNEDNPNGDLLVLEIDADGTLLRSLTYGGPGTDWGHSIKETQDGGYIIAGLSSSPPAIAISAYLLKLNNQLEEEWFQVFGESGNNTAYDVTQAANGDFVVVGYSLAMGEQNGFLFRTDNLGNLLWNQQIGFVGDDALERVILQENGDIITIGKLGTNDSLDSNILLAAFDETGNELWRRLIGGETEDIGRDIVATSQGNRIAFTGLSEIKNEPGSVFVATTTGTGEAAPNTIISGSLYTDSNRNCEFDDAPLTLAGLLVIARSGDRSFYTITDSLGQYEVLADTGTYSITVVRPNDYWEVKDCPEQMDSISIDGDFQEKTINIALTPAINCPYLYARVSTPFLRRCFENTYQIEYGNSGTLPTPSSQIIVTLDNHLVLDNASLPFTKSADQYIFDTGPLEIGEGGHITLYTLLSCEATLGETHCVEAKILPDTLCGGAAANWDGASLSVTGSCEGDEVRFVVKNLGQDMATSNSFVVIEDFVILLKESTPFQLNQGDSLVLTYPANGSTYRIEVPQSEGHPSRGKVLSTTVEGCGVNNDGNFSTEYYTQFWVDHADEFSSIDCQRNIGSWDPNDKRAYPVGVTEEHCIPRDTRIDYHIRFQNTGTDTAFNVVIKDTFSNQLDLVSIRPEVASHPYEFQLINDTVIKFTFDQILLPDSTVNEVASHGYIRFSIVPKSDVQYGAIIDNQAAIYFDYNAPIITNKTRHTLANCLDSLIADLTEIALDKVVKVYPNPASNQVIFETKKIENYQLEIMDVSGRVIRQISTSKTEQLLLYRGTLPSGMYWYRLLTEDGALIGSGKIVLM